MRLNPLLSTAYHQVDAMIHSIQDLPDGYVWWRHLPKLGHHSSKNIRKRWAVQLVKAFFPAQLLRAMVVVSLNDDGIPDSRGTLLFEWLLKNVYCGHTEQLYKDWFSFTSQRKKEK